MSDDWRIGIDAEDWMRRQEKRVMHEQRRPRVSRASDLMGPGLAPNAVEVLDWNGPEVGFNGLYWSRPGALNSPDTAKTWMGMGVATDTGHAFQRVWEHVTGSDMGMEFTRQWHSHGDGSIPSFTPWVLSGGKGTPFLYWRREGAATFANNALTAFTYRDTEITNVGGWTWTGAGEVIITPYSGHYLVSGSLAFAVNSTGRRVLTMHINGTERARVSIQASALTDSPTLVINAPVDLAAGDTIGWRLFQDSGGVLATSQSFTQTNWTRISWMKQRSTP